MTKAIILAAGRGSRMQDHTENLPKCLLQVQGKTLLEWQIDAFLENNLTSIYVVCGYCHSLIHHPAITKKIMNEKWQTTNIFYSLLQAEFLLEKEKCIISYSDIFYSPLCIKKLKDSKAPFAITYDPHFYSLWQKRFENPLEDLETFKLNSSSELVSIGQKPKTKEEIQGQYMGLLKTTPESWKQIKAALKIHAVDEKKLDMTSLLSVCLESKITIKAISIEEEIWGEVDRPQDLAVYN